MPAKKNDGKKETRKPERGSDQLPTWVRWPLYLTGLTVAAAVAATLVGLLALILALPKLPTIEEAKYYQPKLPLRIYSADSQLLAEFGAERRVYTEIDKTPDTLIHAVLAAEDANFFQHRGVDPKSLARAVLANLSRAKSQGGSTISMQVARNMYLSSDKTYIRKFYEILLTLKLELQLTKEQILEIYMNQIYLGQRAYGFGAAANAYFGKTLAQISVAEAAMLAGLPKAPSAYNPVRNFARATVRQHYVLERMVQNGFITPAQALQAKAERLKIKKGRAQIPTHSDYVAELVREAMTQRYGDAAYTMGLEVHTSVKTEEQNAAYRALRAGLMRYEARQPYRGPEKQLILPVGPEARAELIDEALDSLPNHGDLLAAVVLSVQKGKVRASMEGARTIEILPEGLKNVQSYLGADVPGAKQIRRGSIIRVQQQQDKSWHVVQVPQVEGALVAMDPQSGAITSLVGGFDFNNNKFNHATQAWRQPGSSFKPIIYSAALERGVAPKSLVNDGPIFFTATETGGQAWEPKNYGDKFDGLMTMKEGLARSKNMVSIRVLQVVGTESAQKYATKFGFSKDRHPPYLTLALGVGSATPLQMVTAYSVFANGGKLVTPHLIQKIQNQRGETLFDISETPPKVTRAVSEANAFMMNMLLQEVTRNGTGRRAQRELKRPDLFGKTGTTNNAQDAWFVGFQPKKAAAVWVGYDNPRDLGDRETGGGLSLPIWIDYMREALKDEPVYTYPQPEGTMWIDGDWYLTEFGPDRMIKVLGDPSLEKPIPKEETEAELPQEKKDILKLFRN
jgi:penicillin-binding protein 1A